MRGEDEDQLEELGRRLKGGRTPRTLGESLSTVSCLFYLPWEGEGEGAGPGG